MNSKHFGATTDATRLKDADAIIICVPTPLDERREPDLSYVENTAIMIQPHLQKGQLVVLESTTYPGTTEELVLPILEKSGLKRPIAAGPDAENVPWLLLLGIFPRARISRQQAVWLGADPQGCRRRESPERTSGASDLYTDRLEGCARKFHARAEMAKPLENIFRCVNIALVNELKMLSLRMGVDILGK